jgi:hypothetical protein
MPWTPKQTRYLLSKVSPLDEKQKEKMKGELHENPDWAHKEKLHSLGIKVKRNKD